MCHVRSACAGPRILFALFGLFLLLACSSDSTGPETPQIQGTWLIESDPVLVENACRLDFDPTLNWGGETLHITQVGEHITLLLSDYNLDGTIQSNGSFTTLEIIQTDTFVEGRATLRIHFEGRVSGNRMEARVVMDVKFVETSQQCRIVYAFVANRVSLT